MRRAARRDANEPEIIAALRKVGVLVQPLSARGCPDLLCLFLGRWYLLEVKDPAQPPSKRRLTADQVEWHRIWSAGNPRVVETAEQALEVIGL